MIKVYIQICDEGRKFHVSYEGGARYGTFGFVTKGEIAVITIGTTRCPDWMKTIRFNNALIEAQKLYIANQVVGKVDETWHAVEVLSTFISDHAIDAARYFKASYEWDQITKAEK